MAMGSSDVKSRVERGALGHVDKSGVELGEEADDTFDSAHLVGHARAHQPLVVDAQSGGKELVEEGAVLLDQLGVARTFDVDLEFRVAIGVDFDELRVGQAEQLLENVFNKTNGGETSQVREAW